MAGQHSRAGRHRRQVRSGVGATEALGGFQGPGADVQHAGQPDAARPQQVSRVLGANVYRAGCSDAAMPSQMSTIRGDGRFVLRANLQPGLLKRGPG